MIDFSIKKMVQSPIEISLHNTKIDDNVKPLILASYKFV